MPDVTCPSCFEAFFVHSPGPDELPCDVDYDCEICCRPLRIYFDEDDGDILATAYGLGDSGPFG
jgi:hypothetical protein